MNRLSIYTPRVARSAWGEPSRVLSLVGSCGVRGHLHRWPVRPSWSPTPNTVKNDRRGPGLVHLFWPFALSLVPQCWETLGNHTPPSGFLQGGEEWLRDPLSGSTLRDAHHAGHPSLSTLWASATPTKTRAEPTGPLLTPDP